MFQFHSEIDIDYEINLTPFRGILFFYEEKEFNHKIHIILDNPAACYRCY